MLTGSMQNLRYYVSKAITTKNCRELLFSPLELSTKAKQLQHAVSKFTLEEIIPKAAYYHRTKKFPLEIIKNAHVNGFMNVDIPTEYGGLNHGLLSNALISEAIGYGCAGIGTAIIGNDLAATPIILGGSEEIKKKYLRLLINEPVMASYCVTERGTDSDVEGLEAVKQGDEWVINGSKMWITNGGVASWFFVLARTDPDPKAPSGKAFTAFVVDGDSKGLSRGKKKINYDTRAIAFEDVVVPSSNVIGIPGEGFKIAMKTFDKTRPIVSALAVGLVSRVLDEAVTDLFERKDLSDANRQLFSFLLADLAFYLELSRLMTYETAREIDLGRPGACMASYAKCFAADAANQTFSYTDKIFDANSFNTDYGLQKLLRDLNFERKVYNNPFELLDDAKVYMSVGNLIKAIEMTYAAYNMAVKFYFKEFNVYISTHNAMRFLAKLASRFHVDYYDTAVLADDAHTNFFEGEESSDRVWEFIEAISPLIFLRLISNWLKQNWTIIYQNNRMSPSILKKPNTA
uniref:Acyl-CoA dehydrogenase n=1 Tax=Meloidogyne hapla TaxID=6305 RepID=A0A1I8B2J8_MELHA